MKSLNKFLTQSALAALLGTGALVAASTSASAYVVCNGEGECWHTQEQYTYPTNFGVVVHDENWRWKDSDHYRWHEHQHDSHDRGYWHNGAWIGF